MPPGAATKNFPIQQEAPFAGLNERLSDKLVGLGGLTKAENVALRAGRIAPRPGIELGQDDPIGVTATELATYIDGVGIAAGTGWVFYLDQDGFIFRVRHNGADAALVEAGESSFRYLAYDSANDKLYAYQYTTTKIFRIDDASTGSAAETELVTLGFDAFGIAWDATNSKLYITEAQAVHVYNGSTVSEIVTGGGGDAFTGIAVAPALGKIAWVNNALNSIFVADLDGSNAGLLIALTSSLRIAFNDSNGLLYISDNGAIYSLPLTGGTPTPVILGLLGLNVGSIASVGGRLFFTRWSGFTVPFSYFPLFVARISSPDLVSVFPIQRALLEDLEVFQVRDRDNEETFYGLRKVESQTLQGIPLGYTQGSPNFWCTNSRDVDNTGEFSQKSSRASFAWQGTGLDTGRGGVLIADGANQLVFNYVLGDTVHRLTFATAGNVTLTFSNGESMVITDTSTAPNMRNRICEETNLFDHVAVTKSGGGSYPGDPFIFEFHYSGIHAGKLVPLPTVTAGTGTASITVVQAGGSDTGANCYLRPCGLPRPAAPTSATTGTGKTGYYSWMVTFVSDTFGIESPPSPVSAFRQLSNQNANITVTIPGTLWFDSTMRSGGVVPEGPLVNRVRLYRRRWGASGADGTGANGNWYFVKDALILAASYGSTQVILDDVADAALTDDVAPGENEYPPANANFVVTHKGFAVWAGSTGPRQIWISETAKSGQLNAGQLGYEYVRNDSFENVQAFEASDVPFVGLHSDGNVVLIATPDRAIAAQLVPYSDPTPNFFHVLEGVLPPASHWVITNTRNIRGVGHATYWLANDGHAFRLHSSLQAELLSLPLEATPDSLIRKYWNDIDTFGPLDSWMWASVGVDRQNHRILWSVIKKDTLDRFLLVYDFLAAGAGSEWTIWTIPATVLWDTRNQDDELILSLAANGSKVYTLKDGANDAGTLFNWSFAFGAIAPASPFQGVNVNELAMDFNVRDFGGDPPEVSIAAYADGADTVTKVLATNREINAEKGLAFAQVNVRGRRVKFEVSGSQAADQSHAELVAVKAEFVPSGYATR